MPRRVRVHEFAMGDVEDPEIYAAVPLQEFLNTEWGKWLTERALEAMTYHITVNPATYGYCCRVTALLSDSDAVYYLLVND